MVRETKRSTHKVRADIQRRQSHPWYIKPATNDYYMVSGLKKMVLRYQLWCRHSIQLIDTNGVPSRPTVIHGQPT